MNPTPQQLRTLILDQPEGSPIRIAFALGRDFDCEQLVNDRSDPQRTVPNDPPVGTFVSALDDAGLWSIIEDTAKGVGAVAEVPNLPKPNDYRDQLISAAKRIIRLEKSPQYTVVEGLKAAPLLGAFPAFGLASAEQIAPAMALLSRRASIVEKEFGPGVYASHFQIAEARAHA